MFDVKRDPLNPIIRPDGNLPWQSLATYNACPVELAGKNYLVYRAQGQNTLYHGHTLELSTIGISVQTSTGSYGSPRQLVVPTEPWDLYGCEDPRVTKIGDKYCIFYTAISEFPYGAPGIKVAVAITKDLETVEEKHLVTPFNAKAFTLFPEKVNGKYCAILTVNSDLPPSYLALAYFDKLEDIWSEAYWEQWYDTLPEHTIELRRSQSDHVEVGGTPLLVDGGWLMIYSHIQNYYTDHKVFGIEALLLERDNPSAIKARTSYPLMVPEDNYERYGRLPNITFPSGASITGDTLTIHYGATDTYACRATLPLSALLESMSVNNEVKQSVQRYDKNPILLPISQHSWEANHVLNPAAVKLGDVVYILYRAVGPENTSVVGLAESHDGYTITKRYPDPIYVPRADFELKHGGPTDNSGCEDARVVHLGDRLYITYTAYNSVDAPQVAMSSISVDEFLTHKWDAWTVPQLVSPAGIDDKDAAVFSQMINGHYLVLHRIDGQVCADYVDELDFSEDKLKRCIQIFGPRPGMWDSRKVGIAGPPMLTDAGWLLFYHGITDTGAYCLGAVLLNKTDPTVLIGRTALPLMTPVTDYELQDGWVNNVVFPCGQVEIGDDIFIYYGGADHVVGVATINKTKLLQSLS
jgi:predicted GH43/DUF377 family glycosyl hydrolase